MAGLTQLIAGLGKAYGGYKKKQFGEAEKLAGQRKYKQQLRGFRRGEFDKKISAEKAKEKDLAARLGAAAVDRASERGKTKSEQLINIAGRGDTRGLGALGPQQEATEKATQDAELQAAQDVSKAQKDFSDYASKVQSDNEGMKQKLEAMELARGTGRFDAGRLTEFEGGQDMTEGGFEAGAGVANMAAGGFGAQGGRIKRLAMMANGGKYRGTERDTDNPRVAARVEDLEEMREGKARRKDIMKGEGTRKERRASAQEDIIRERAERKARNEKRKSGETEEDVASSGKEKKKYGKDFSFPDNKEDIYDYEDSGSEESDDSVTKKGESDITKMLAILSAPSGRFAQSVGDSDVFAEDGGYVGKDGGVTEGEFSHEENPIDMVNEDGEKVGEVTGGE